MSPGILSDSKARYVTQNILTETSRQQNLPKQHQQQHTNLNIQMDGVGLMQNVIVDLGDEKLEREEKQENSIDPRGLAQSILAGAWSTETGVSGGQSPRKRFAKEGMGTGTAARIPPQHRRRFETSRCQKCLAEHRRTQLPSSKGAWGTGFPKFGPACLQRHPPHKDGKHPGEVTQRPGAGMQKVPNSKVETPKNQ